MIIGISGKIGSGKDTIGKIIQYLTMVDFKTMNLLRNEDGSKVTFEQHFLNNIYLQSYSNWQIKKFADKLKECVSLILNISREDLEKIEVKNRILGEEWTRYGYADYFYRDMNGTPIMNNKQCSKEEYEEHYKINWQTTYKHEYTVRDILQLFGTEACRNQIHTNFWVNALFSEYTGKTEKWDCDGNSILDIYPNWIITDMRFPNELEAVKKREGITIRCNRTVFEQNGIKYKLNSNMDSQSNHPSEIALDNATFDYTIDNNGTIGELIVKVKEILIKERII